ncbi:hypothetical protein DUNSADRAFT_12224 [Dunaliella salina]|uniref:Uncharacterized protein n=1 Tax=Dunaliella salina TaxID=3046 RepID=A0ABQ7GBR0_DUNSA|nr:hypothetical protein DUNSADRAFT_12224 [Dunaliella salina]|eukprot:KAF5832044.1 hypothetical protein DUNSADRAFT_12224 [Dunaliella salina]
MEATDACLEACRSSFASLTCKGSSLKHEWVGRGDDGFPVMEGKVNNVLGKYFDLGSVLKHEWVGMGDDGFPVLEGKVNNVMGEFFEIWKLDKKPVDDTLRATIKAYCTGMVSAINRYYAFGSVFVDDGQ